MRSQLLAARSAFAALVLAVLTAAVAAAGVRLGELSEKSGTTLMIPATALGAIALAGALLWFRSAFVHNKGDGKRMGLIALLGSLVLLYWPLSHIYYGFAAPAIHDATSDPEDPPQFVALAKIHPANSRVFDGQQKIRFRGEDQTVSYVLLTQYREMTKPHQGILTSPQKAFWRSFEIVKGLGWTIVDASEKDLRIEATDRSLWFGRYHDIVIRVRPAGAMGSRVDVRSESREGDVDHGRNVTRLKAFFRQLRL
jgi:hypothetical protein